MHFINANGMDDALRSYIRLTGIGCNSVRVKLDDGQQHHGSHIKRRFLPADLVEAMDTGEIFWHLIYGIYMILN